MGSAGTGSAQHVEMRLTTLPIAFMLVLTACDGPASPDRTVPVDAASGGDASVTDAGPALDAAPSDAGPTGDAATGDAPPVPPAPATTRLSNVGRDPHVAMDAAGDAVAIWCEGQRVVTRRYVHAVGWQAPIELDPAHCWQTRIAMTAAGEAVALWLGFQSGLWTARYSAGAWSAPVQLDGPATGASVQPTVAVDAAGNAIVSWVQGTWPSAIRLWARQYAAGTGTWEPSFLIDEHSAGDEGLGNVRVGFDAAGAALLLWRAGHVIDGDIDEQLWSRRFVAATGWGPKQQIPGHTGATVAENLVVRADGSAYAVWKFIGGATGPVHNEQSWFTPAAGWTPAERVSTEPSGEPTAALDASGRVIVAWNTTGDITYARRFTGMAPEDAVVGPGGFAPRLAPVGSDELTLAWTQQVFFDQQGVFFDQLWARRFTWGSWGSPMRLDEIGGVITEWQIVAGANGSAAIWLQTDGPLMDHGTTWGIWAAVW